jgi:SAM-dependent methyltransferase
MSREISTQHVTELSSADTSGYWWYAVRQGHVESLLRTHHGPEPMDYLDLGCGAGGVLAALSASMSPRQALGLDGTQEAVDIAKTRGLEARYADFRAPLDLPFAPTAVTCLDVLEHLEDPVLALRHLREAAMKDAVLVVTVPAMPSLHSTWDDVCGHFRRYTATTLREHLGAGGWSPVRVRHFFSYCVPPAWWQRRVTKAVQEMEFPPVSPLVNKVMTVAGHMERAFGSFLPFGTSLVAVARPAT